MGFRLCLVPIERPFRLWLGILGPLPAPAGSFARCGERNFMGPAREEKGGRRASSGAASKLRRLEDAGGGRASLLHPHAGCGRARRRKVDDFCRVCVRCARVGS